MPRFPWRLPVSLRKYLPRSCRRLAFSPFVETRIRRRVRDVCDSTRGLTIAEIALDEVEFAVPRRYGRGASIAARDFEVEIELRDGTGQDLDRLVRAVRHRALRPNRRSKLERAIDHLPS